MPCSGRFLVVCDPSLGAATWATLHDACISQDAFPPTCLLKVVIERSPEDPHSEFPNVGISWRRRHFDNESTTVDNTLPSWLAILMSYSGFDISVGHLALCFYFLIIFPRIVVTKRSSLDPQGCFSKKCSLVNPSIENIELCDFHHTLGAVHTQSIRVHGELRGISLLSAN